MPSTFHNDLQAFQAALSVIGESRLFNDENKFAIIVESLSAFTYHDFQNFMEARNLQPGMPALLAFVGKQELTARQYFEVKQNKAGKQTVQADPAINNGLTREEAKTFAQTELTAPSEGRR